MGKKSKSKGRQGHRADRLIMDEAAEFPDTVVESLTDYQHRMMLDFLCDPLATYLPFGGQDGCREVAAELPAGDASRAKEPTSVGSQPSRRDHPLEPFVVFQCPICPNFQIIASPFHPWVEDQAHQHIENLVERHEYACHGLEAGE